MQADAAAQWQQRRLYQLQGEMMLPTASAVVPANLIGVFISSSYQQLCLFHEP
jgi:hypothetical protein